jgi:glucokinase
MIAGVDIGGHHVAAALVDPARWAIVPETRRYADIDERGGRDELLDTWAALIDAVAALAPSPLSGVGVGLPGPFDYRSGIGRYHHTGKFETLNGVRVGDELRARCSGSPEIRILNDATAFAVGCVRRHPDTGRAMAMTLGTGFGSAFVDRGLPVISGPEVPPDGCVWHLPFEDGIADDFISSRWICREAREHGLDAETVADLGALAATNPAARDIFARYGANLGAIIAPWVRSFGCHVIVFGGRITRAFDLFSGSLRDKLAAAGALRPILIEEDTEAAAMLGSALCFDEAFWTVAKTRLPSQ